MKICFCQGIVLGFEHSVIILPNNIWAFVNSCQDNIGLL